MIISLVRLLVGLFLFGVVYATLAAFSQLPPEAVAGLAMLASAARGLNRVIAVDELVRNLAFEATVTLALMPVWIYLKLWKRFSPQG